MVVLEIVPLVLVALVPRFLFYLSSFSSSPLPLTRLSSAPWNLAQIDPDSSVCWAPFAKRLGLSGVVLEKALVEHSLQVNFVPRLSVMLPSEHQNPVRVGVGKASAETVQVMPGSVKMRVQCYYQEQISSRLLFEPFRHHLPQEVAPQATFRQKVVEQLLSGLLQKERGRQTQPGPCQSEKKHLSSASSASSCLGNAPLRARFLAKSILAT